MTLLISLLKDTFTEAIVFVVQHQIDEGGIVGTGDGGRSSLSLHLDTLISALKAL